jgi:hypothetical protein
MKVQLLEHFCSLLLHSLLWNFSIEPGMADSFTALDRDNNIANE